MYNDFEIKPLTAENPSDFLTFFEGVEFTDHPGWSVCYCYSFHFAGPSDKWNRDNNRSAVRRQVNEMKIALHGPTEPLKRNGFKQVKEVEDKVIVRRVL